MVGRSSVGVLLSEWVEGSATGAFAGRQVALEGSATTAEASSSRSCTASKAAAGAATTAKSACARACGAESPGGRFVAAKEASTCIGSGAAESAPRAGPESSSASEPSVGWSTSVASEETSTTSRGIGGSEAAGAVLTAEKGVGLILCVGAES